jgi:hypothetical protein
LLIAQARRWSGDDSPEVPEMLLEAGATSWIWGSRTGSSVPT